MFRLLFESTLGNPAFDISVAIKLLECATRLLLEYMRTRKPHPRKSRRGRRRPPVQ